jgi:hypothetical protein
MEQWRDNADSRQRKNFKITLFQYFLAHHKSRSDCTGILGTTILAFAAFLSESHVIRLKHRGLKQSGSENLQYS